jgi:hypothetical protein
MQHQLSQKENQAPLSFITPRRCAIVALIFFLMMVMVGAIPGYAEVLSNAVNDKLLHLLAYSILTGLIYYSLPESPIPRALRTLVFVALLGGLDEIVQTNTSYRSANLVDWAFDMLAGLSCLVFLSGCQFLKIAMAKRRYARQAAQY